MTSGKAESKLGQLTEHPTRPQNTAECDLCRSVYQKKVMVSVRWMKGRAARYAYVCVTCSENVLSSKVEG